MYVVKVKREREGQRRVSAEPRPKTLTVQSHWQVDVKLESNHLQISSFILVIGEESYIKL